MYSFAMAKVYRAPLQLDIDMDDLNMIFEQYRNKFANSLQAMKAIGGKLDEERGETPHMANDWLAVLEGPVIDEKAARGLEEYAYLLYGTKDEDWKAVRKLGLKTSEIDVVLRLRPKSYGHLLKMTERYAKKVYEIDPADFSQTPRE